MEENSQVKTKFFTRIKNGISNVFGKNKKPAVYNDETMDVLKQHEAEKIRAKEKEKIAKYVRDAMKLAIRIEKLMGEGKWFTEYDLKRFSRRKYDRISISRLELYSLLLKRENKKATEYMISFSEERRIAFYKSQQKICLNKLSEFNLLIEIIQDQQTLERSREELEIDEVNVAEAPPEPKPYYYRCVKDYYIEGSEGHSDPIVKVGDETNFMLNQFFFGEYAFGEATLDKMEEFEKVMILDLDNKNAHLSL